MVFELTTWLQVAMRRESTSWIAEVLSISTSALIQNHDPWIFKQFAEFRLGLEFRLLVTKRVQTSGSWQLRQRDQSGKCVVLDRADSRSIQNHDICPPYFPLHLVSKVNLVSQEVNGASMLQGRVDKVTELTFKGKAEQAVRWMWQDVLWGAHPRWR